MIPKAFLLINTSGNIVFIIGQDTSRHASSYLKNHVETQISTTHIPVQYVDQNHERIQVRTTYRTKNGNKTVQTSCGGHRIDQKLNSNVGGVMVVTE